MKSLSTAVLIVLAAAFCGLGCTVSDNEEKALSGGPELDAEDTPFPKEDTHPIAPLPAWETPEEKAARSELLWPYGKVTSQPPTGEVYTPAEYARMQGVIIHIPTDRYSTHMWDYFANLVQHISDSGAYVHILEPSEAQANYVLSNILKPRGVRTDLIRFVYMKNDAFWSRDYGPWHIYVDGERAIVNHTYFPTRVNDNAVPKNLGQQWDEDVYSTGFYTEGGNFMTDGQGTCWASTGIFDSNKISTSAAKSIYEKYLGCESVHFIAPLYREGTTHIDMFSKILNQDTILVGYSNTGLGANTAEIVSLEDSAKAFENMTKPDGGKYDIVRIPMTFGYDQGYRVYYTHTNSLIVNNTVLVPTYGRGTDSEALEIYRNAMPGYVVVGIDSNATIPSGGAIHCTTMQVPTPTYSSCGNGVVEDGEACDFYLNGATCKSLGYAGGTLKCSSQCTLDTSDCGTSDILPVTETETKTGTVVKDDYDYLFVESTNGIRAVLSGTGDADLYVWNRSSGLTWSNYDCRPYLDGSNEVCEVSGTGPFYVIVRGYASTSDYKLDVTYYTK
jgi:agmatine/peptidylarginine deiminase